MILIVHGGQTGVDRGGHEAAIAHGWPIKGYMPREGRDELGMIPQGVARFLVPHDKPGFTARTEANVQIASAALLVVSSAEDPRKTPGTAKTLDLAACRRLPLRIADPTTDPMKAARWIWNLQRVSDTLLLPFEAPINPQEPALLKLLIAGPRESKWRGAQEETVALLHRIALALAKIKDLPGVPL